MPHAPEAAVIEPEGPASRFYGWRVVSGLLVVLAFSSGLGFYNLSVILAALSNESRFSVTDASGATATFFLVSGLSGLGVAALIERHDPRLVMATGSVLAGTCLALLGQVESLWQLYLIYAVFGIGFAASGLLPATTLVTRWFVRRRSIALSVASTGLSLGGVMLTPFSARFINDYGLRASTPWLGLVFVLGIVPITLLVLRPSPASLGLQPDGDPIAATGNGEREGTSFEVAIRTRFFVMTSVAYVFVMLAQVGGISHQFNLVSEWGERAGTAGAELAALAVSTLAFSSIVGRLLGGFLLTRLPMRPFTLALMLLQGVALGLLALADSRSGLLLGSAAFGITVGNLLMLQPLLLAAAFGTRHYPRIYSFGNVVTMFGVAAGPVLIGLLRDRVGGYGAAFLVAGGASLVAMLLFALAGRTRHLV